MKDFDSTDIDCIKGLISRGFFSMAFQPIVRASTGKHFGFEALLRGPAGTPLADPCRVFGQEAVLGFDMLTRIDKACIGSAARSGRLLANSFTLFININGQTFDHLSSSKFIGLLDELGIRPENIVFEISERTTQDKTDSIMKKLAAFRKHGIRVALDDIGVRHPWLSHMLTLEPDFVKVDRSLIAGIDSHPRNKDMVHGLALLSERMGSIMIAEGVENIDEHNTLAGLGVPLVQGYYYGKPHPAAKWSVLCIKDELCCPAILGYNNLQNNN